MTDAARHSRRVLLTVVVASAALICRAEAQRTPVWGRVPGWLTAFDYPSARLAQLVAAAGSRPDSILPLLDSAVRFGPGAATVRDYELSLGRIHRRDSLLLAQRKAYHLRSAAAFVADYQRRLDTTWKVRAALGLGRIAWVYRGPPGSIGARATTILQNLAHTLAPSPALTAVQRGLDSLYVRDSLPH